VRGLNEPVFAASLDFQAISSINANIHPKAKASLNVRKTVASME